MIRIALSTRMPFSTLAQLEDTLLRMRLVDPAHLQEAKRMLGGHANIEGLIRELEALGVLTSYQSGILKKGETEGLRVGGYKLLYRNASGSFARVFRGAALDGGQMVAIKVLRQRLATDPRAVMLFRREGELGKRLQHKNIVPIYEVGSDGNQHYFTMEFVEGGNFRDFIKIRKKFSPADATKYVLDIAEGLEYALSLGLTHRDLKLSNVLLSAQGVAKLVDFGLAGQDASFASIDEEVDRAIEYATIEKNTGAPVNDPRSDLYFLGAIYYELLTGQPPYPPSKRAEDRKLFSRYRDVRPVRNLDPSLPWGICEIVDKLMTIDPDMRYQSPSEVVADLRRINGAAAESSSATSDEPAPKAAPVVICVENRAKQQDALREYFTKHGYRVLVLTDPIRALNRVDSDQPAGLIFIGEALGKEVVPVFQAAVKRCRKKGVPVVLALSKKLKTLAEELPESPGGRVLTDAVTLRDIRHALSEMRDAATK
ncbi:MAG TPA: serine/threonine-protein kinase [Planctomycetaceae bacterium]|nr:serine/threonine-protein kinase [Planctomycetaceae bacterium]